MDNYFLIQIAAAFVIILSLISNLLLLIRFLSSRSRLPIHGGKPLPSLDGVGKVFNSITCCDQNGRAVTLGKEGDFNILISSLGCPACKELNIFLSANQSLLTSKEPFYIITPSDPVKLSKLLYPATYSIFNSEALLTLFGDKTLPVLFLVRENRINAGYIVNTGEHILMTIHAEMMSQETHESFNLSD